MRARTLIGAGIGAVILVALAAVLFEPTLEEAALLAPVIVVTAGATAAIVVLWTRIAVDAVRRLRRPKLVVAGGVAALAVLIAISFLVDMPSRY